MTELLFYAAAIAIIISATWWLTVSLGFTSRPRSPERQAVHDNQQAAQLMKWGR